MFPCSPFFRLCAQGDPSSHIDRQPMATGVGEGDSAAARYPGGRFTSRHETQGGSSRYSYPMTAPRPTLFGAAWHALSAVGMVLLVAVLWLLVTYPRGVLVVLGGWIVYRIGRLVWYAFRNDAKIGRAHV